MTTAPSRFSVIALDQLSKMAVLEDIDTEDILSQRLQKLKEYWADADPPAAAQYDVEGLEFDPIVINQECSSYFELMLRDRVNQAARAVTLAFATGTDLDAIATRYPGGVPRLSGESDDRYRRRIWLSPNALSPHGSAETYVFWALTADSTLRDASAATVEGTGVVEVTILPDTDSMVPTQTQLIAVRAYILEASRKGLTDVLSVRQPKVVATDYEIDLYLYPGPDEQDLIDELTTALENLIEEQRWLGFDHTLTAIQGVCAVPGVHHVDIIKPSADLIVPSYGVVRVDSVSVVFKGRTE
jgi:phage-related baseplate assembly protein